MSEYPFMTQAGLPGPTAIIIFRILDGFLDKWESEEDLEAKII
jgi:hypothetical protein